MGVYLPIYKSKNGEKKQSHVWWLRVTVGGKQYRESTGERDRDKALVKLDLKRRELLSDGVTPKRFTLTYLCQLITDDYRINGHRLVSSARSPC